MKKEVIAYKNPKSPISEIFKTLRTNIQFMNVNKKMQVLLLTSTYPGEGKSWVTSNLAVTFAQAGKRVIIIDSDMRKGRQYAIFGVSPTPGLSNFLSEVDISGSENVTNKLGFYIQETEINNLHVMTAGNVPPNPSELLVSGQMIRLLEELRNLYDLIIIDGTPSELVTDAVILSRIADSTIIVTAHKKTKKDALERVIKNIKNVGGKIAGVVINKVPVSVKKYGERYYYAEENKMIPKKVKKEKIDDVSKQESKIKDLYNEKFRFRKASKDDNKRKFEPDSLEPEIENTTSREIKEMNNMNFGEDNNTTNETKNYAGNEQDIQYDENLTIDEKKEILKQINDFLDQDNNKM